MSDAGIAFIAGGFALAGSAVRGTVSGMVANWLQTKDRAERKQERDADEKRRLRRESFAPVFAFLEERERVYSYRLATTTAAEVYSATVLRDRIAEIEALYQRPDAHSALRAAMAGIRLNDNDLALRLMHLEAALLAIPFDHANTGRELGAIREVVIEHASS